MTRDFEYMSYDDADRIAILENRAAELERRLLAVLPQEGRQGWGNVGTPGDAGAAQGEPTGDAPGRVPGAVRYAYETDAYVGDDAAGGGLGSDLDGEEGDGGAGASGPPGRTEALINHGRSPARPARARRILAHWRLIGVAAVALLAGIIAALVAVGGGGASWPGSVTTVKAEIKQACENPDVAAEPSGLNFACGKDTQPVLWVFPLLPSGNSAGCVDQTTGRKGLEPIQAAQGGDIAWSLNLHHPYDPANPIDSLQVAARAINNIISGATLTSAIGGPRVEPGMERKATNCQRYPGSAKLLSRSGYPARWAAPLSSAGATEMVSDV